MKTDKVHIVGGGIIGLCSAYYLAKAGCDVTIVEKNDFSDGTSFGNAGMVVPSHFVPMAMPGVISQGLKWMLNNKSPFSIKPRLDIDLVSWLWNFYKSANLTKAEVSMPVLYALNQRSKELYKNMAAENAFEFGFEEKGLLMLCQTEKHFKEEESLAIQARQLGLQAEVLNLKALQNLEPEMDLDVLGGIYFPGDAHLNPNKLMDQLIAHLKQLGVKFLTNTSIVDFEIKSGKIESLLSIEGEVIPVHNVLLTSGCWTADLLKKAGVKIHLQDGKGYSLTIDKPKSCPRIPTILSEAKVAITPMGDSLRIAGTLELSGMSTKINKKRVAGILESSTRFYKNLDLPSDISNTEIWTGYRPCTPDGMPYVGRSEKLNNLFVGTGHGMMGLSLGAVTGKVLSDIMTEQKTFIDIDPFRLDRF